MRNLAAAAAWYEQLSGAPSAVRPNEVEAVWEVAANRSVYIEVRPAAAGHSMVTLVVEDFDERMRQVAERALQPDTPDLYNNGVRKYPFRDPDGNEVGFGGAAT